MGPKVIKKEEKTLWSRCGKCKYLVPTKKLETKHECKGFGIHNNLFYTDKIYTNVPSALEAIQSSYSERFVIIPHTIASLCSLAMNKDVIIEFDGAKRYARNAWIVDDKNDNKEPIDHVCSTSKGM